MIYLSENLSKTSLNCQFVMGQQQYWAGLNQPPCSHVMVQENHYPHPYDKALEHFEEFGLEQLILCLVCM
jgi:hypothetical protein